MRRLSIVLHFTALSILIGAIFLISWYVVKSGSRPSYDLDKIIQNSLLIVTSAGAIITTMYALFNNHLSLKTYQNSLRPAALFQVTTLRDNAGNPITIVVYGNKSNDNMEALNVNIKVQYAQQEFDLSYLFPSDTFLPARDERNRRIDIRQELLKHNFDISKYDNYIELILVISYSFKLFGRVTNKIKQQYYIWEYESRVWSIK